MITAGREEKRKTYRWMFLFGKDIKEADGSLFPDLRKEKPKGRDSIWDIWVLPRGS